MNADVTAPSTKPSCTEAVNQTLAAALNSHSALSAGATADAENHTPRTSTWTTAMRLRCPNAVLTLIMSALPTEAFELFK
jgi:hypothetical protein